MVAKWSEVKEGSEIPTLTKNCSTQQLVQWAAASGDFYQIHYDVAFAKNNKLDDIIVHGALKNDILGHGKVLKKYEQDGAKLVDLEIWSENPEGTKTTPGYATVKLAE